MLSRTSSLQSEHSYWPFERSVVTRYEKNALQAPPVDIRKSDGMR